MPPIEPQSVEKRTQFSCDTLVFGLEAADCSWLQEIELFSQGMNSGSDNGIIWLGESGPNVFAISNFNDNEPITVVVWYQIDDPIDFDASFVGSRVPYITYSLAVGQTFEISVANGISGGLAAIDRGVTTLDDGQVFQTWVEFTTGDSATMDISREINMGGDNVIAVVSGGCEMSANQCAYVCNSGNDCGTRGSNTLLNCLPGSQPGASGDFDFVKQEWVRIFPILCFPFGLAVLKSRCQLYSPLLNSAQLSSGNFEC